jgi:vacuolar-type H+-ATPase subunit F/Vma7
MTGRVLVVASSAVAAGFRLAGVRAEAPASAQAARELLRAPPHEVALLLVEESCLEGLAAPERRAIDRRPMPVLVPFPVPTAERADAIDEVLEILRRAIGYRVRLQ